MAERLRKQQPTSSIASALRLDAVRAAIEPVDRPQLPSVVQMPAVRQDAPIAPPPMPEPVAFVTRKPTGEQASVMRQFQLTPSADATLRAVIDAYSRATGIELTRSEFLRAVLHALEPTVTLHEREGRALGPLRRSKNDAWLLHKRDELERLLARAFTAAMRAHPHLT